MSKVYTRADFDPFIASSLDCYKPGRAQPLPNAKPIEDTGSFLANMAALGHSWSVEWGYSRVIAGQHPEWTMFFLTPPSAMIGSLGGGGYAVRYESGPRGSVGKVYSFAICEHEKEEGPGANHQRGWHPGKCRKCGMDMSVDSGD